ncbi:MAG TPA: efflux RND transporter permease subunit [Alphaproteobacteria bacterium]
MTNANLSEWALRHRSFVVYLMVLFTISGVASYFSLGRDEDPAVIVKTMVVGALWPGATTLETMAQVTDRLEKKLEEIPSLDFLSSYTKPGQSVIYVNLKEATPPKDMPEIWYQVRKKIGDIQATLPEGVLGPFFNDDFGDTFGTIYAFTADGFSARELRDYVEFVRADLLRIPGVGKIELIGAQDETIYLKFSTRRLASLGITIDQIAASLRAQNALVPGGIVNTGSDQIAVRVSGEFQSEQSLRGLSLRVNDRFFHLEDVVDIKRGTVDPPKPQFRYNGEPAIGLAISMKAGGDVLDLGRELKARMARLKSDLPVGIEAYLVSDQPVVVKEAVDGFMEVLIEAVLIVLAISFLSLGFRAGLVVAFCIPLVLVMTFLCMKVFGIELQRVSLGALIIALGLLVDDAIITVEMMIKKIEEGMELEKAATFAYTSTAFPMLTGTLVTCAGFVPIGFAQSAAGEYTFSIFAVVSIALLLSWIVAVIFAPLIGIAILPRTPAAKHGGGAEPSRLDRLFRPVLLRCLNARLLVVAGTAALFALSVFGLDQLQQQFFPPSERPEIIVDLRLPAGASMQATAAQAEKFEKLLVGNPNVDHFTFYVGEGAVRFYLPLDPKPPADNFAQAVVVAKGFDERNALIAQLRKALDEDFDVLLGRVSPLEMGPPVGWPVKYRIGGGDPERVRAYADELAAILRTNPSVHLVNFDWNETAKVIRLKVNQDAARLVGVSSESLARTINQVVSGTRITQVRDGIYLIDVVARAEPGERASMETLRDLQITLENGHAITLGSVAELQYGFEDPLIWRRNRLPTITVQADVTQGVEAATVVRQLAPKVAAFGAKLPLGYAVEVGGSVEDSAKGLNPVLAVVPVMLILMTLLLMIQLQSVQRMLLAMSVAPLGLIGVVAALLITGRPLGFVAILGVIALAGMIIRNSVILIDQIETDIAAGQKPWDAVILATTGRLRPILLTAAAAILGMVPISVELFWGPMALAVMGGLAVATLLTLLFLPALYLTWFRIHPPPLK